MLFRSTGLEGALADKVDKNGTDRLITEEEAAKLSLLVIDEETGQAAISGTVNASQVQGLDILLDKKVDKIKGKSLVDDAEIARLAKVDNYNDTILAGRVTTAEGKITNLETESAKHALKTDLEAKADKSVVDAMYTNAQIDGFIADAKKYEIGRAHV